MHCTNCHAQHTLPCTVQTAMHSTHCHAQHTLPCTVHTAHTAHTHIRSLCFRVYAAGASECTQLVLHSVRSWCFRVYAAGASECTQLVQCMTTCAVFEQTELTTQLPTLCSRCFTFFVYVSHLLNASWKESAPCSTPQAPLRHPSATPQLAEQHAQQPRATARMRHSSWPETEAPMLQQLASTAVHMWHV